MFFAEKKKASLSPSTNASYSTSLFVAWKANLITCDMTTFSGEYKMISALTLIFRDGPYVFNFHHPSIRSIGGAGLSSSNALKVS